MKRLTRSEIKAELEKPNGSAEIMNDSTIDKISLCDETTAMFIEENIGSALMIRLAKSRAMLLRMSGNPALLPAVRKALASDTSPKLRRNAARLIGLFTKDVTKYKADRHIGGTGKLTKLIKDSAKDKDPE